MNERIRELELEAYKWAVKESQAGLNVCSPGSNYFLALEKEKFAELIVKECANRFKGVYTDQVFPEQIDKILQDMFGVK